MTTRPIQQYAGGLALGTVVACGISSITARFFPGSGRFVFFGVATWWAIGFAQVDLVRGQSTPQIDSPLIVGVLKERKERVTSLSQRP